LFFSFFIYKNIESVYYFFTFYTKFECSIEVFVTLDAFPRKKLDFFSLFLLINRFMDDFSTFCRIFEPQRFLMTALV